MHTAVTGALTHCSGHMADTQLSHTHACTAAASHNQTPHLPRCEGTPAPPCSWPCTLSCVPITWQSGGTPLFRACMWAVASGKKRLAAAHGSPVPREARYHCCRLAWCKQRLRQRPSRLGLRGRADRCVPCRRYLLPFYPSASGGRPSMPRTEHAHSRRPLTRSYPLISRRMGSCWDE